MDPYDDIMLFKCANDVSVPPLGLQFSIVQGVVLAVIIHYEQILIDAQRRQRNRNVVQREVKNRNHK